jgi:hypothetical protein
MTDLYLHAPLLLAALTLVVAAATLRLGSLRVPRLQIGVLPFRQRQAAFVAVLAGLALMATLLAGCGTPEVIYVVASPTPTPLLVTKVVTPVPPTESPAGAEISSIDFVIPDDQMWEKTAGDAYSISGQDDTFAWSRQRIEGDFEFSAEVESDFANYGEAMVVVYGDGEGWTPGCLIFNVTGYWQAIRAHSIYDPEVEWLAENEEQLDFAHRNRYRMTIRVAGDQASLFVDGKMVASAPMMPQLNREGYIALVKYGGSAPVSFRNIAFKTGDVGEAIAAVPSRTPASTTTANPTNTPTPLPPPTQTSTATPLPPPNQTSTPTPKPSPRPTSPPTATPPPPFRPPTGMLEDHRPGGTGELLIKNGTDADALVILTGLDDKAVKSAYIRNSESFNMTGVPDGTYRLYYSKGEAFNKETKRFTKNATYQRLDATLEFTSSAMQYTTWEVTLYGVVGGNVGSEPVDPSQFP